MKLSYFRSPDDKKHPPPERSTVEPGSPNAFNPFEEDGAQVILDDASRRSAGLKLGQPGTASSISDELYSIRRRLLNRVIIIFSIMGGVVYLVNLPIIFENNQWVNLALYTLMVLIAIGLVIERGRWLSNNLRSMVILLILFLLGVTTLTSDGLYGNGRIYLITVPLIASLLLSGRRLTVTLLLSIISLVAVGLMMSMKPPLIPPPVLKEGTGNTSLLSWIIASISFIFMAVISALGSGLLIQNIETSLHSQQKLAGEILIERESLERRVDERTQDVQRRLVEIRTAADVSRSIGILLNPAAPQGGLQELLPRVCELVRERFDLYYVGIFLVDEPAPARNPETRMGVMGARSERSVTDIQTRYAVLAAGTGEAGARMLAQGHKLEVGGDSMIGWATDFGQARIASDVRPADDSGAEAVAQLVRFNNPLLPDTRSELALPILAGTEKTGSVVLGALTIQSHQPSAFDQDDITVLQGIADSLALGIETARLFSEQQASLQEIRALHRQYLQTGWSEAIASQGPIRVSYEPDQMQATTTEEESLTGESADLHSLQVPIRIRDQVIGNLVLEIEAADGRDLSSEDEKLVEAVTDQLALALENARLITETQRRAEAESLVSTITSRVWASPDIDTVLRVTIQELGSALQATDGWIELGGDTSETEQGQYLSGEASS
ncbi:MAG: GAF domain-containing protein [Anaerolineales bacterium]|nr:GAF domain-containing protein [Anaerolineales bacterium]